MTPLQIEKLISLYGNGIYGFCYHLAGSVELAEDLYQETMLKTIELKNKIKCRDDSEEELLIVRNYCMGIAVNLYKNITRKEKHRAENYSIDAEDNFLQFASGINIERDNIEIEMKKTIRDIVFNLPEKKRITVYMFYYAEMSIEDIAKALHIPKGTVKSRLNSARSDIKSEMEEKGYEGF